MPKQIFDDDQPLLDYGSIDELSTLGIGDRGYANVTPPDGGDHLFEDQFERRAAEIDRTPNGTQPVVLVEQKYGPWTANNQFGSEKPFAAVANNNESILKLPEWGFPQVWSVMLSSTTEDDDADYTVIASVEAGVGGITDTFEVDWQPGITFSVVANALNITARYEITTSLPSDLRLRAMVGREPLNGNAPTRTFRGTAAAGARTEFVIPKYAKSVVVLPGPTPNNDIYNALTDYEMTVSPGTGLTVNVTGAQLLAFGNGNEIPIPGHSYYFGVDNNTGVDLDFVLVFKLGL